MRLNRDLDNIVQLVSKEPRSLQENGVLVGLAKPYCA